jgi:hypothetical protein
MPSANKTPNYNLTQYSNNGSDKVSALQDYNEDMSKIDAVLNDNANMIATKANMDTTYSKADVDTKLGTKADISSTYSKTDIDSKLGSKADTVTTYSKTDIDKRFTKSFQSVAEMKAFDLSSGDTVSTLGFSNGDGYCAQWEIGDAQSNPLDILLDNGKYASYVDNGGIRPESIAGVQQDYSQVFSLLINNSHSPIKLVLSNGVTYKIDQELTLTKKVDIEGNGAIIEIDNTNGLVFDSMATDLKESWFGGWNGITFTGTANVLVTVAKAVKGYMRDCLFKNFPQTGLKTVSGYEMVFDLLRFETNPSLSTIGIDMGMGDSSLSNIIMRDCHTGIRLNCSTVTINNFHAWIYTQSVLADSKFIDIVNNCLLFGSFIYSDTYATGINIQSSARVNISGFFQYVNSDIWGDPTVNGSPATLYTIYYTKQSSSKYTSIKNACLRGASTNTANEVTNATPFLGFFEITDFYNIDFASIPFMNILTPTCVGFTLQLGSIIARNNEIMINAEFSIDSLDTGVRSISWDNWLSRFNLSVAGFVKTDLYNNETAPTLAYGNVSQYEHKITFPKIDNTSAGKKFALNCTIPAYQSLN